MFSQNNRVLPRYVTRVTVAHVSYKLVHKAYPVSTVSQIGSNLKTVLEDLRRFTACQTQV